MRKLVLFAGLGGVLLLGLGSFALADGGSRDFKGQADRLSGSPAVSSSGDRTIRGEALDNSKL